MVTGPGGTGKTHLIKSIVEHGKGAGKRVQVCALTGCAAVLLECGAKTIHSWSGMGLASADIETLVERVRSNKYKSKAWRSVDLLIVDEVSMMSKKVFDILDAVGRAVLKQPRKPFGGLQVMFSGDFYQLPPVGDREEPDTVAFCFESSAWRETFPCVVVLKSVFRQSDPAYIKVLNQVRKGVLSKRSFALLKARVIEPDAEAGLAVTQLVPRRCEADRINARAMQAIDTESQTFNLTPAQEVPAWSGSREAPGQVTARAEEMEFAYLRSSVMVPPTLELKVGAQVMCVANITTDGPNPIVNGSRGVVKAFEDGAPVVEFAKGHVAKIGKHVWASESLPGVGIEQIPLIPAWAITIHKAQGVTLDEARLDAGTGVFECGQTYVGLSRVRSIEGLFLTAFDPEKIRVNVKVREFYDNIPPLPTTTVVVPPPVQAPPTRPCPWKKEHDERLWVAREDPEALKILETEFGRGTGAIRARLRHLRNPSHKAFVRLHGQGGAALANQAAARAATVAKQSAASALGAARASGTGKTKGAKAPKAAKGKKRPKKAGVPSQPWR